MDKKQLALGVLAKVSGNEAQALSTDMELAGDLSIDSAKALQLLADLEDALEVEISDEDAARMNTVGDILEYVAALG